jgi:hypothetical protein
MYRSSISFGIIFALSKRKPTVQEKEKCNLTPVSFTGVYIDAKCNNIT